MHMTVVRVVDAERSPDAVKAEEVVGRPAGGQGPNLSPGSPQGTVSESDGPVLQQLVCYMQVSAFFMKQRDASLPRETWHAFLSFFEQLRTITCVVTQEGSRCAPLIGDEGPLW